MKNIAIALLLAFSFAVSPVPALAQTDTGPTPGSFWYGVTTAFENVNLFFTFNNEKKITLQGNKSEYERFKNYLES